MRAILVDDERLALMQLQTLLERDVGGVCVIGVFNDPMQALASVAELEPDVAFLDIQMPGMNGMKLAEQLQALVPELEIVFITGYNQYAVEAFELSAMDYIMKPVLAERLIRSVDRLKNQRAAYVPPAVSTAPVIGCFHQLQVQSDGMPHIMKWRTSKALELFAYLLHYRRKIVSRDAIFELLWPDFDETRASQHLYTTIYNIRRTLKSNGLNEVSIQSSGSQGGYVMDPGKVRIDVEEWEKRIQRMGKPVLSNFADELQALEMYEGDYLGVYDFLWAEAERERLRRMWMNRAQLLSSSCIGQGMVEGAVRVNLLIQERFPYEEKSYYTLMKLYDQAGDHTRVNEQYKGLTAMAEKELNGIVSDEITDWYAHWKR